MRSILLLGGVLIGADLGSAVAACPAAGTGEPPVKLARPADGVLLTGFGMRRHPLLNVTKMHTGIDLSGPVGDPVRAAEAGEVVEAGYKGEYGNYVRIRHRGGLATAYAHLKSIAVRAGDCLEKGAIVGGVGNTGLTSGPALHFEVIKGDTFVDPAGYLFGDGG